MSENDHKPMLVQEVSFDFAPDIKYNPRCLCDNTGCARHGNCRACVEFHRLTDHPSTCRYAWKWRKNAQPEKTVTRRSES